MIGVMLPRLCTFDSVDARGRVSTLLMFRGRQSTAVALFIKAVQRLDDLWSCTMRIIVINTEPSTITRHLFTFLRHDIKFAVDCS